MDLSLKVFILHDGHPGTPQAATALIPHLRPGLPTRLLRQNSSPLLEVLVPAKGASIPDRRDVGFPIGTETTLYYRKQLAP